MCQIASKGTARTFGTLSIVRAGCFLLLLASLLSAEKRHVTLTDMLEYSANAGPVPSWSPSGTSFAYEKDGSVYLYRVSEGKAKLWFEMRKLASAAKKPIESRQFGWQNRRVSEHKFQWFPNCQDLLTSADGDIFVVHPNGEFDQVTRTDVDEEDPKLSPDGKEVLYRSLSNLYVIDLATKQTRQLTTDGTQTLLNGQLDWVYPEELDISTASWWSPDSKRIAYLQFDVSREFIYPQIDFLQERATSEPQRYPQAGTPNAKVRLGVISVEGGATTWMHVDNGSDVLLARVAWLPDSTAVALEVVPRLQNALDLVLCDPVSGAVRTVLHEQSPDWINVADNLWFLKSRPEFLWTSERSGFRHIYRYSLTGELLGHLTEGQWQVNMLTAVNEVNGRVYFTSSEASPLETQLFSVGLDGRERTRLTDNGFNHTIYSNEDGSYLVDDFSSMTMPPESVLRSGTGKQIGTLPTAGTASLEKLDLRPVELQQVKTPDGATLYAKLLKPAGFEQGKKYPAIVHVYGGPGAQDVRNIWNGVDWDQLMAARGYVVWHLDNRGSMGRGHAFEAPLYHNLGKQEVADQRLGVQHLIAMGFVDPNRIGITGWSYGGYMTIRCLLFAPDLFKVGVAGAPVTDWHNYDTIYTERYMGLPDQNAAAYDASSNVKNAARLEGKLFIVHNIEDDNVLFQNTVQMANAFEEADRPYFLQIYPQKTHGVTGVPRKALYGAMADFFDQHLK